MFVIHLMIGTKPTGIKQCYSARIRIHWLRNEYNQRAFSRLTMWLFSCCTPNMAGFGGWEYLQGFSDIVISQTQSDALRLRMFLAPGAEIPRPPNPPIWLHRDDLVALQPLHLLMLELQDSHVTQRQVSDHSFTDGMAAARAMDFVRLCLLLCSGVPTIAEVPTPCSEKHVCLTAVILSHHQW